MRAVIFYYRISIIPKERRRNPDDEACWDSRDIHGMHNGTRLTRAVSIYADK